MSGYTFRNQAISWHQLEGFDHFSYHILDVDRDQKVVDAIFKFAANEKIALHRHLALNHMLVLEGEHVLYEPDGTVKEVRPAGRYTVSQPDHEPHQEGGQDRDVIILFSIRGTDGDMYEILDNEMNQVTTLGMDDFEGLLAAQAA